MERELENIGLSRNEARVYIILLQLGSSAAGEIAEKSRVYRTNVYEALNRLIEKGLVSYINKGNQKFFQAEDPNKILNILKEKEEAFKKVLPQLTLNSKLSKNKEKVTIYEGENGIKTLLFNMLKEKEETNSFDEAVAFGIPRDAANKLKAFIKSYHKKRGELKLHQRLLYDENAKRRIEYLNKLPFTEAVYFPSAINSPATTTIYSDKVMFWIWSEPILSILIESKRMADAYRRYFDILYAYSKREIAKLPKDGAKIDLYKNLRNLISETPVVFYALKFNEHFDFLFVSDNVGEVLGYEQDEIVNNSNFWRENIHPEDFESFSKELQNLSDKTYCFLEFRLRDKDGKYKLVNDNMILIKAKDNKPFLILGFLRDFVDIKEE